MSRGTRPSVHRDEARRRAVRALSDFISAGRVARAAVIEDVTGTTRVLLWLASSDSVSKTEIDAVLKSNLGAFWSGDVWISGVAGQAEEEVLIHEEIWSEGTEVPSDAWGDDAAAARTSAIRVIDRRRALGTWFEDASGPLWPISPEDPRLVVFYSFKGGVGRTTALAAFAMRRAHQGERVAVVDCDLDAPGVGVLLSADPVPGGGPDSTDSSYGVVDYILEQRIVSPIQLRDYYHACRRPLLAGAGEILVIPAGRVDAGYLGKLARLDLEPPEPGEAHPILELLEHVRTELKPHWILVDSRSGLSGPAGLLLSGIAHLHVILTTAGEQSWQGIRRVIERLGAQRVRAGRMQGECVLVHSMIAPGATAEQQQQFVDRAEGDFESLYYAEIPEDPGEDPFWDLQDMSESGAPHQPCSIHYEPRLATFSAIDDVAAYLLSDPQHGSLEERITGRFSGSEEASSGPDA